MPDGWARKRLCRSGASGIVREEVPVPYPRWSAAIAFTVLGLVVFGPWLADSVGGLIGIMVASVALFLVVFIVVGLIGSVFSRTIGSEWDASDED